MFLFGNTSTSLDSMYLVCLYLRLEYGNYHMSELKEVIFQHFEEAKQYTYRMDQKHDKQDDERRAVLYRLKQAYDNT